MAAYPPESLEELRALLTRIEGLLQAMAPAGRVAGFGPAGQTGRIMLSNRYPEEMLFIVNGTSYRVAPGSTRVLDPQPAGTITYEVLSPTWGLLRRRTTTLAANEPFRINVD